MAHYRVLEEHEVIQAGDMWTWVHQQKPHNSVGRLIKASNPAVGLRVKEQPGCTVWRRTDPPDYVAGYHDMRRVLAALSGIKDHLKGDTWTATFPEEIAKLLERYPD